MPSQDIFTSGFEWVASLLAGSKDPEFAEWLSSVLADPMAAGPRGWGLLLLSLSALPFGAAVPLFTMQFAIPQAALIVTAVFSGLVVFRVGAIVYYRVWWWLSLPFSVAAAAGSAFVAYRLVSYLLS